MELTVEDDAPGFPGDVLARGTRDADERGSHIGLANTRGRLGLLYADAHTFRVANRPEGGARIVIEIPLHPFLSAPLPAEVQHE